MKRYSRVRSAGAIALGACCAVGTLVTLFWTVRSPSDLTTNHILIGLALVCALGSGHYFWQAARQFQLVSAVGFGILFIAGTAVCAVISAGRGAETLAKSRANVVHADGARLNHERQIAEARVDRDSLRTGHDKALKNVEAKTEAAALECRTGPGGRCRGATQSVDTAKSYAADLLKRADGADAQYWRLVAQLDNFKPTVPPNIELRNASRLWSILTGYDEAKSVEALELLWPFLLSFLTELGTIVFLNYGVGHRSVAKAAPAIALPAPVSTISSTVSESVPDGWVPKSVTQSRELARKVEAERVFDALRRAARPVCNDELADLLEISKGEASKRVTSLESVGLINRARTGRYVAISLRPMLN